jgi:hypothetical protein
MYDMPIDLDSTSQHHNSYNNRKCSICYSETSYSEKTKWGVYEHWYGTREYQVCKRCYIRKKYQEKFVPFVAKCDRCQHTKTTLSKYRIPRWVNNRNGNGGYLCWSCYTIIRNTGRVFSQERKANIKAGIRLAVENGVIFGRKVHTINEAAFNAITEESAYWIGFLIADGNVYTGKTGNPRISLTLKKKDYDHLVKFRKFMNSTYNILTKKVKLNDKTIIQYTLRFSSKIVARVLATYGIVPKKSLIAKVIGLENNRDFWRGVLDGDGYFCVRNGHEGDKIILLGSHDLLHQFKDFVQRNIPESITKKSITIKQEVSYYRLFIYSKTARLLAKLLYDDCTIALNRKLPKALKMIYS